MSIQNVGKRPNLRHPLKRARGLGSAKDGTGHFIIQRITAIALVFLSIYAVVLVVSMIGSDFAEVRRTVANPWNATFLVAFLIATFWHAKLGMQVVIEDYVHAPLMKYVLLLANSFFCVAMAAISILAVLKLHLLDAGVIG